MSGIIPLGFGDGGTSGFLAFGLSGSVSDAPLPNMTAVVRVRVPARAVVLRDFSTLESSVRTLDLTGVLDPGGTVAAPETIVSVDGVSLAAIGPAGASDSSANSRILTAAGIQGSLVSVELGDWDEDIPLIQYLLTIQYTTTRQSGGAVFGVFWVRQPGL